MEFITHYTFKPEMARTGIDYSEVVTVPDLVLSMQEIYERYAVRGDISGLANNMRPPVTDDFDLDDPALDFVPEEDVDVLQYSRELRMRKSYSSASVAADSQPGPDDVEVSDSDSDSKVESDADSSPIHKKPAAKPASSPSSGSGSE